MTLLVLYKKYYSSADLPEIMSAHQDQERINANLVFGCCVQRKRFATYLISISWSTSSHRYWSALVSRSWDERGPS